MEYMQDELTIKLLGMVKKYQREIKKLKVAIVTYDQPDYNAKINLCDEEIGYHNKLFDLFEENRNKLSLEDVDIDISNAYECKLSIYKLLGFACEEKDCRIMYARYLEYRGTRGLDIHNEVYCYDVQEDKKSLNYLKRAYEEYEVYNLLEDMYRILSEVKNMYIGKIMTQKQIGNKQIEIALALKDNNKILRSKKYMLEYTGTRQVHAALEDLRNITLNMGDEIYYDNLLYMGIYAYNRLGDCVIFRKYINQAEEYYIKNNEYERLASVYNQLVYLYFWDNYEQAKVYMHKEIDSIKKLNCKYKEALVYRKFVEISEGKQRKEWLLKIKDLEKDLFEEANKGDETTKLFCYETLRFMFNELGDEENTQKANELLEPYIKARKNQRDIRLTRKDIMGD